MYRFRHLRTDESGVAIVEFALVLPLVVLLLMGVMQFGRAFNSWNDANQMAADAARFAVVNRNPSTTPGQTLQQYIAQQADSADFRSNARVCIYFPEGTSGVGKAVKVVVQRPAFDFAYFGVAPVTLTGSATMRIEVSPTSPGVTAAYSTAGNSSGCPLS